jgi:hypothetical protein
MTGGIITRVLEIAAHITHPISMAAFASVLALVGLQLALKSKNAKVGWVLAPTILILGISPLIVDLYVRSMGEFTGSGFRYLIRRGRKLKKLLFHVMCAMQAGSRQKPLKVGCTPFRNRLSRRARPQLFGLETRSLWLESELLYSRPITFHTS